MSTMLKGIPKLLSPELLKVLCEMGHSDRIVIGDGNFPAETMGKDCACVIRYDGQDIPALLDAILTVFPLDTYVDTPVCLMELMDRDKGRVETPIWDEYKAIVARHDDKALAICRSIHIVLGSGKSILFTMQRTIHEVEPHERLHLLDILAQLLHVTEPRGDSTRLRLGDGTCKEREAAHADDEQEQR